MNKGKKSIFNAITALMQMVVVSITGLVLTKTIISTFGSDYNGINSTVTQIVNAIMILEGGFTLASNVALFSPFSNNDYDEVNGILSATSKRFKTVGVIALAIGVIIALIFPYTVESTMPSWMISALMLTALAPACFNLGVVMKYRVLILTDQREYIISIISTVTFLVGNVLSILLMMKGWSLLVARIMIMLGLFACYFGIIIYCRNRYRWASFKEKPLFEKIKGTGSVLVLKLTSMFYLSFPIIIISTLPEKGTMIASVYAVYRSVMTVVSNGLGSLTNAPRLGFGALFAENRENDAKYFFYQYEKISCILLSAFLGTTCLLLMPFVELYTSGITDINYVDKHMAAIMLLTIYFETIHIPSGQMIQMKGDFGASRRIQSIACIVLVISMIAGRLIFGIYGIISAVLLAAIVIAVMEIWYTGKYIFGRTVSSFVLNAIPCLIVCAVAAAIGMSGKIHSGSYLIFFIQGVIGFASVLVFSLVLYYIADREGMKGVIKKVKRTI